MMFSTVRFDPVFDKDAWTVRFYDLEGDRVNDKAGPNVVRGFRETQ